MEILPYYPWHSVAVFSTIVCGIIPLGEIPSSRETRQCLPTVVCAVIVIVIYTLQSFDLSHNHAP